jgi:hypothetical protein
MTARKHFHILLPVVFFLAAVLAAIEMEVAIGHNLEHSLSQVFFLEMETDHSRAAEAWFWIGVICCIFGVAATWRAFN